MVKFYPFFKNILQERYLFLILNYYFKMLSSQMYEIPYCLSLAVLNVNMCNTSVILSYRTEYIFSCVLVMITVNVSKNKFINKVIPPYTFILYL